MKLPLEIITDWVDSLPQEVREKISFFVTIRLLSQEKVISGLTKTSEETLREYLGERLNPLNHLGRALSVCAVIDFIMFEMGDENWWKHNKDMLLNFMEWEHATKDMKMKINADLPDHSKHQAAWIESAEKWHELRGDVLSLKELYVAEAKMRR
jgi:hypothetical protein